MCCICDLSCDGLFVVVMFGYYFFFFKQKTAYEMRISDWSSDVCSSDLISPRSLPCTPCAVPSRCLRKYSWPLPDEPSRFERHTNMLRGQLAGSSGSKHDISSSPDLRAAAT